MEFVWNIEYVRRQQAKYQVLSGKKKVAEKDANKFDPYILVEVAWGLIVAYI